MYSESQKEEGMEIVSAAICAGIFNDLGSGSNVDLCIITKASSASNFAISSFFTSIHLSELSAI